MRLAKIDWALAAVLGAMTIGVAACGSSSSSSSNLPTKIGSGEGQLNLVAWEGYAQPEWVKPFEAATGCAVHAKYAGSSDEMVTLMRQGGGSTYDMVSASGDASLRLISGGNVKAMNVNLVPEWKNFIPQLQSPPHNTVNGVHYGISLQWGPNTLLYNTKSVKPAPTSWEAIYSSKYKGSVTVPSQPDPDRRRRAVPVEVAPEPRDQRPLRAHRSAAERGGEPAQTAATADQEVLDGRRGRGRTVQERRRRDRRGVAAAGEQPGRRTKCRSTNSSPSEGATGWADTWMLSAHAKHPNCAYKWVNWVSTPKVQAEQAISFGETPANTKACPFMEKIKKGSCVRYHANAPSAYFESIKFWKTPVKNCGNGKNDCTDYSVWQRKWTEITA